MTDRQPSAEPKCIHAPVTVGRKPFNDTVEMESFTIQVYAPTPHEFQKRLLGADSLDRDFMRQFYITQSAAFAAEALQKFLCEREGVEIPKEEP